MKCHEFLSNSERLPDVSTNLALASNSSCVCKGVLSGEHEFGSVSIQNPLFTLCDVTLFVRHF